MTTHRSPKPISPATKARSRRPFATAGLALLLAGAIASAGCDPEPQRRVTKTSSKVQRSTVEDDFDRGRNMLFKLYEYNSEEGSARCSQFFNQWLRTQDAGDWKPSPMIEELGTSLREFSLMQKLESKQLSVSDVEYMESMLWLRDVSRWVGDRSLDPHLQAWIDQQEQLDKPRLELAAKLFDWTIRNIMLTQFILTPDGKQLVYPGTRTPRMAVLLGHADTWVRSRIFIQLCRQAGLDAVMLAMPGEKPSDPAFPWATAVLLDEQLYLFDAQLGLPIPVQDDQGIATLAQAQQDPQILANLSLGSTLPYPVQAEQIQDVVALIDAAPEALSLRMDLIESRLTGDYRIALTAQPDEIRQKLEALEQNAVLWTVSIEAAIFKRIMEREARKNPRAKEEMDRQKALFVGVRPLIMGRKAHLQGQFSKSAQNDGAKLQYMAMRLPDEMLDKLPSEKEFQEELGLEKGLYERDDEWESRLFENQRFLREAKMHGSYWIGLVQFEEGNYEAAKQWLGKRVLEEMPNSLWTDGARYNLARTFERNDNIDEARRLYLDDSKSPQRHGNLLRARRLKQEQP